MPSEFQRVRSHDRRRDLQVHHQHRRATRQGVNLTQALPLVAVPNSTEQHRTDPRRRKDDNHSRQQDRTSGCRAQAQDEGQTNRIVPSCL